MLIARLGNNVAMTRSSETKLAINRKHLVLILVFVLSIYVVVPQLGDFRSSWHLLLRPQPGWVVLAIALTAMTYLAGSLTYCLLAFKSLRYGQVALVQLAAMFINRLLPGGIGALGANYAYLRHERHSLAQATSVVAINNILGVVGHGLLVAGILCLYSDQVAFSSASGRFTGLSIKIIIGISLLMAVLLVVLGRKRFMRWLSDLGRQLLSYRRRPWRLPAALLSSMTLTTCNVLCLLACAGALGVHLSFAPMLLILSFGVGAGAITPTPGGLGGFEAGLVAGLIAYNVPSPVALAVALLYRIVSYWLPLVVGALAFVVCQRRNLFVSK